jgi:hypothetical protein
MNSRGAALKLKEIARGTLKGSTVVKYRLLTSGLPRDKIYSLVNVAVGWAAADQPIWN